MKLPSFEEWFADTHNGRSFDDHYYVQGTRQDVTLMRFMQETANYAQAMAQLTHDTLMKALEDSK
ncbi:hypothetical protein [Pseudomonas sp. KBW05]|uniref:hypothetical protein n=1 Tax=Pseudomonas sp. KBW05 TaxID=2153360 RepID=UPI000F59387E|nr:hypothetical protein [Pseudomonas sp. KBW05]